MTEQSQQESVKLETEVDDKVVSRSVPYTALKDVEFYSGYTELLSNPYRRAAATAQEPVFPFPPSYAGGFDYYTSYLITKAKLSTRALVEGLKLAHHLGDDDYLKYLITNVLLSDWKFYSPVLQQLPTELQADIYHHLPYSLIPAELANQYSFFQEWVEINGESASFSVTYDASDEVPAESLTCTVSFKSVDGRRFMFQLEEYLNYEQYPYFVYRWYDIPQLGNPIKSRYESPQHGERGEILDTQTEWYETGEISKEKISTRLNTTETSYLENGNKSWTLVTDIKTDKKVLTTYYNNEANTIRSVSGEIIHSGEGYRHGDYEEWSSDGRVVAKGRYSLGEKVGSWQELQNGVVMLNLYENDILVKSQPLAYPLNFDGDDM